MATGAGNGRKGRNGKEQAAAPAAISEASSDLSEPDLTSAFQPACSIAPRSTRKRISIVTIETRSRAILGNLQHQLENRNPFSMKVMRNADRLKVGAGSRRIALCRLRPFYGLRHASSFGFVHVARQGGWLLRHTMSGPAHEFIPETAAPASDARLAALWRSVFSSKDGLFCRLFRLKFALVSGPRVYQLNAGIDARTEKEFHELTEWLTATFQIRISIDLQNNFLKIRFA